VIVADLRDGFQADVAARDSPLVVLLEHESANETDDGIVVGEDADNIRAPLDFFVQSLEWIGGVQLVP
jgi:hypothetical protein